MTAATLLRELGREILLGHPSRADAEETLENAIPALADALEAAQERVDEDWRRFAEYGDPEDQDPPHSKLERALAIVAAQLQGERA